MSKRDDLLALGAGQYRNELSEKGMTEIVIPEFDDSFYCPPALDVMQRSKLSKMLKEDDAKTGAYILACCARYEDNERIFKDSDVDRISKSWNPKLVDRVAAQMLDIVLPKDESTVDDALKNSKATPNCVTGSGSRTKKESA